MPHLGMGGVRRVRRAPAIVGVRSRKFAYLRYSLLLLLGFFVPWGSGLQLNFAFDVSKIFPTFAIFSILAAWYLRKEAVGYPKKLWLFLGFVSVHTIIVYTIFCPNEFGFGYNGYINLPGGYIQQGEMVGILIARWCLFALTGWAVAILLQGVTSLYWLIGGYFGGLSSAMLLGGYQTNQFILGAHEVRLSAGFLDGNAFGLTAGTCVLLLTIGLRNVNHLTLKILTAFALVFAIVCTILSGSRGALAGAAVGLFFVYGKGRGRLGAIAASVAAIMVAVAAVQILRPEIATTAIERLNIHYLSEDVGAGRLYIWRDYLMELPRYFLSGMGFGRSREGLDALSVYRLTLPHNIYLGAIVEFGIFGGATLILMLSAVYARCKEACALVSSGLKGLLLAWLVVSAFLDTLSLRDTWLILGICCAAPSFKAEEASSPAAASGNEA
jgi:O-antigen ligase